MRSKRDAFSRFADLVEPRLLRALIASVGPDAGRDATAVALPIRGITRHAVADFRFVPGIRACGYNLMQ